MALEEILDVERLKGYLDLIIKRNTEKHIVTFSFFVNTVNNGEKLQMYWIKKIVSYILKVNSLRIKIYYFFTII